MAKESRTYQENRRILFRDGLTSEQNTRRLGGIPASVTYNVDGTVTNATGYINYTPIILPSAWSIRIIFEITDLSSANAFFGNTFAGSSGTRLFVDAAGEISIFSETNDEANSNIGALVADQKYELVVTNDGSGADNINFYIDGVLNNSASLTSLGGFVFRQLFAIGDNRFPLVGSMDLFEIYNYALSSSEIWNLAN